MRLVITLFIKTIELCGTIEIFVNKWNFSEKEQYLMVFEIEHCNLVYKLGMVTTQSEQEILFEIVTISPVTAAVTNSVSVRFSKTI